MQWHTVHRRRVHHHRQRAGEGGLLEGLEILLANHQRTEIGRRTVFTGPRRAVGKVVLRARSHVELVDMIWVVALIAFDFSHHHLRIHDGIFAEALPDARPTRVTAQVHHGIIHPRTVGCTALVSRNLCTSTRQLCIKCRAEVNRLGEQCATHSISHAVVVVQSVDIGDAEILHRLLLNQPNPLLPVVFAGSTRTRGIQNRTHLPLRDEGVEHRLVEFPHTLGVALIDIHRESTQPVDNLLVSLTQNLVNFCFRAAILLQYRTYLFAVYLGILNGHLSDDVEIQFQHLTDFLVQRHLRKGFLYLGLQLCVAWNGRRLCMEARHGHHQQRK